MSPFWIAAAVVVVAVAAFIWRRTHPRAWGKLALREGNAAGLEFPLSGRVVSIGSEEGRDVMVSNPKVSAFHATLTRGDGGAVVLHDRSRSGTVVNGTAVEDETELRSGDLIRLADSIDLMFTQLADRRSTRGASHCPE
ncbi:MAG: FHA domain-containing protein, partial [Gemmatimonadetes bacterium]|nr:FHA domain-containing protein [Gemmatimonadota bacterium]